MGLFINTASSLLLIYTGTFGVNVLFSRYAAPEAWAANDIAVFAAGAEQLEGNSEE